MRAALRALMYDTATAMILLSMMCAMAPASLNRHVNVQAMVATKSADVLVMITSSVPTSSRLCEDIIRSLLALGMSNAVR